MATPSISLEFDTMQVQNNNKKLLIIEQSAPMLRVLSDYCKRQLLNADCHADPVRALAALRTRFDNYEADYSGIVLGWPEKAPATVEKLLDGLSQVDHSGLPLIVLCQRTTGEIRAFTRRRPATQVLQWRDYQQLARLIAGGTLSDGAAEQLQSGGSLRILLIDSAPGISMALHRKLSESGHAVDNERDVEAAVAVLASNTYDLVACDWRMHADSSLLQQKLAAIAATTALVMLTDELSNTAVVRSVAAGAIACIDKSETPVVLCQHVESLIAVSSAQRQPRSPLPVAADLTVALQQILAAIDQPALLIDQNDGIVVASDGAQSLLGAPVSKSFSEIAGQSLVQLRAESGDTPHLELQANDGASHKVSWHCRSVSTAGLEDQTLFVFAPVEAVAQAPVVAVEKPRLIGRNTILDKREIHAAIHEQMQQPAAAGCQALLLLDLEIVAGSGDRMDLGSSEPMLKIVRNALVNVYKGQRSIAYLGEGRFAFLLSTARVQDALVLTRKLLQVVPKVVRYADALKLVSHGALLYYGPQSARSVDEVLQKCSDGCQKSRLRGDNLVYVIHMNQWLRAHDQKAQVADESLPA